MEDRAILCWLATVSEEGLPNVSPKEVYAEPSEGVFLIAEIASGRSLRNIRANPAVCISLIDVFSQRGRRLEGRARVVPADSEGFDALAAPLLAQVGTRFRIRNVIAVDVSTESAVRAPSYLFYPETEVAEMREGAMRSYGVRPRDDR